MQVSDTQRQFFQVLDRLKNMNWDKQFQTLRPHEFIALSSVAQYHEQFPEVPGIYVSEFASRLGVALPAASKILKNLEKQGWLKRTVDPENRRNTFVSLTEEGLSLVESESAYCCQMSSRVFERMGAENTTLLLGGINRLLDLLEEEFV